MEPVPQVSHGASVHHVPRLAEGRLSINVQGCTVGTVGMSEGRGGLAIHFSPPASIQPSGKERLGPGTPMRGSNPQASVTDGRAPPPSRRPWSPPSAGRVAVPDLHLVQPHQFRHFSAYLAGADSRGRPRPRHCASASTYLGLDMVGPGAAPIWGRLGSLRQRSSIFLLTWRA